MEAPREEEILQLSTMKNVRIPKQRFLNGKQNWLSMATRMGIGQVYHTHTTRRRRGGKSAYLVTYPVSSIRIWNRRDGGSAVRQRLFPFFYYYPTTAHLTIKHVRTHQCVSLKDAKRLALDYMHFASSSAASRREG